MKKLENSLKDLGDELGDIDININDEDGKKIEAVQASELKSMLPRSIAGMKKSRASSEKSGAFGFNVAQAEAVYEDDDERSRLPLWI